MPYIPSHVRPLIDKEVNALFKATTGKAGHLNYAITRLILRYLGDGPENYERYQSVVGLLECVLREFYRKKAAKYEDARCLEHGEVY